MPVRPWRVSTATVSCLIGTPCSIASIEPHPLRIVGIEPDLLHRSPPPRRLYLTGAWRFRPETDSLE